MARDSLSRFQRELKLIQFTRKRIDGLHSSKMIVNRDAEVTYEALFLRLVTSFEAYLEQLFSEVVAGKHNYPPARKVSVRITATSDAALKEVMNYGRNYADWLPFERTQKRARVFMDAGRPFTDLTRNDVAMIDRIYVVRHAIAHRSEFAMKKFKDEIAAQNLLPRERSPAGYLMSMVSASDTRFDVYAGELARLSAALS